MPDHIPKVKVIVYICLNFATAGEGRRRRVDFHYSGPAVQDFFQKDCWAHHPKPYSEFVEWRAAEDRAIEEERSKLIPGL